MVVPLILKIVAFSLAKKVVVFLVAKLYGFPRLYRRVSEFNHYINRDNPKRREKFQNWLQFLFQLPSHIYRTVQQWRGVEPPQGPPSSASGHSHGASSGHSQHNQVREIHTGSGALRVISSLSVPNPTSRLSGFSSISQSIRSYLLGLGGGNRTSRFRPFSASCTLPFGVPSLITPTTELESLHGRSEHCGATGSIDSHVAQVTSSLQDSQSGIQVKPNIGGIWGIFESVDSSILHIVDKQDLLQPRPAAVGCTCVSNTKLQIQRDLEAANILRSPPQERMVLPQEYFKCTCRKCSNTFLSSDRGERCEPCKSEGFTGHFCEGPYSAQKDTGYVKEVDRSNGLVKANIKFLVTDKLQIMPSSALTIMSILKTMEVVSVDDPESNEIIVGITQILQLLHSAISSNTCLNDVFTLQQTEVRQ